MIKSLILVFLVFFSLNVIGQIDLTDSSAQVVGYWDINEKQVYSITKEKYKIKGSDTTSRELMKYMVDITIVDSTEHTYTIDWHYRDFVTDSESDLVKKMTSVTDNMTIRIVTDEFGAFKEVKNWKEVRSSMRSALKILKKETKAIPNMDKLIKKIGNSYDTKEAIEATSIKDMQQFYTFHGARYIYQEQNEADVKLPNLLGGEPFDGKISVWLDEINSVDNNFILRMYNNVDSEQLTEATYNYLVAMAETLETKVPSKEDFPKLTNDTYTASRIHGTGWLIYSIETKEVKVKEVTTVEERIIELQ